MLCYECSQAGTRQEAIGVCQHFSVGLCQEHSAMIADQVTMTALINRMVLPKKARVLLCSTCLAALQQERIAS